jgi:hypothetical protein
MLGNLDKLVWREAQPGLARMAREGHGFNVSQSENDPALNGHNNVTLRAIDSVLLDCLVSLGLWASDPFYEGITQNIGRRVATNLD